MIATLKNKAPTPFPTAKITRVVKSLLPKGNFELRFDKSKLGDMKIVRVITPAWKSLQPPERISKVLTAMNGQLSEKERDRILRFSVLTPEEYETVVLDSPTRHRTPSAKSGAKKLAAKRKAKQSGAVPRRPTRPAVIGHGTPKELKPL